MATNSSENESEVMGLQQAGAASFDKVGEHEPKLMCLCGHEREYHGEHGCMAETAKDETCRCRKFFLVTQRDLDELADTEKRGVKWIQS